MANQASIYIIFKRDKLPHDVNSVVGAVISYIDHSSDKHSLDSFICHKIVCISYQLLFWMIPLIDSVLYT